LSQLSFQLSQLCSFCSVEFSRRTIDNTAINELRTNKRFITRSHESARVF